MSYPQILEITIVVLNLLFVILLALERRIGWIAGALGSALFVITTIQMHLYMDMVLNSYYVIVGIYGWISWGRENSGASLPVTRVPRRLLTISLLIAVFLTAVLGSLLSHYTDNALPYLDAGVTVLSFIATWMSTRKYIENWLIWLVADPFAIALYAIKGGYFYPILFGVYTVMAVYGYIKWKKHLDHAV